MLDIYFIGDKRDIRMVKKSSNRKTAPLASFESLISLESCAEENKVDCGKWREQENHQHQDLQADIDLTSLPWTSPAWQRMSVSSQNCQVYQVINYTFSFLKLKKLSETRGFVSIQNTIV